MGVDECRLPRMRAVRDNRPYLLFVVLATLWSARAATLEIPIFAGGYGTAFYEETAREFERLRPGTKLNVYGDPRIADKLRVRVIDGNLPDGMLPQASDCVNRARDGLAGDVEDTVDIEQAREKPLF